MPKMGSLSLAQVQALIDAHTAVLNAHGDFYERLPRTGDYTKCWPLYYSSYEELYNDTIMASPFFVARPITIDRLAIHVKGAASAGKVARLGIYNNGVNNYPGTLLLDAGTVGIDSTGVKAVVIDQALARGLYWFVILGNEIFSAYYDLISPSPLGQIDSSFLDEDVYAIWSKHLSYGVLPDPFPEGATRDTIWFIVLPRIASLD